MGPRRVLPCFGVTWGSAWGNSLLKRTLGQIMSKIHRMRAWMKDSLHLNEGLCFGLTIDVPIESGIDLPARMPSERVCK